MENWATYLMLGIINNYIKAVINISFITNKYINDEEPWKLKKSNLEKMNNILYISLNQIGKIAILLSPIIPVATNKVLNALNVKESSRSLSFLDGKNILNDEIKISNLDILLMRVYQPGLKIETLENFSLSLALICFKCSFL